MSEETKLPESQTQSLNRLRGDLFGGLTAAVVALPLALAFGTASGAGPIAGLYGAIAVGFFASLFGGTRTQISGPTGPMTVVMASIVALHAGNLQEAFAIVFLGGVIQVGFGFLKVGRYVAYTPYSVMSGFMSGIGVIILLLQVSPLLGLVAAPGGPIDAVRSWHSLPDGMQLDAVLVGITSLAVMLFWPGRLRGMLPAPLAALLIGTVLGMTLFRDAPVIGQVPTGIPTILLPTVSIEDLSDIIQPAFILALLGSIDSLLTSLVADTMTRTQHDSDRELIGQGIGNMAAALVGGLPGAGATMRTVVNVRAGGSTRISGMLHALILLALALGLAPLIAVVPHAVLAGILAKIGWDIIDWGYLKRFHRAPRAKVLVMFITMGLTVFVDLITAVAVGLILAGFVTARWMEQEELKGITSVALSDGDENLSEEEQALLQKHHGRLAFVMLRGRFSYASARQLVTRVNTNTSGHQAVVLDFTDATHLDTTAALAIEEIVEMAQSENPGLYISGLTGTAFATLSDLGSLERIAADRLFDTRGEAITAAGAALDG